MGGSAAMAIGVHTRSAASSTAAGVARLKKTMLCSAPRHVKTADTDIAQGGGGLLRHVQQSTGGNLPVAVGEIRLAPRMSR
jgi:hypothetical protein